ncbi:MAG TPA: CPBP family glutamic-type intramembrane protease [Gemmatimonadales bacterium]|nr:CPBP family glutamic-type intramembrane protease [Gemmatimonadales bacterium]
MSPYFRATRTPRYSLLFALPLLVLYEVLAFALSHSAIVGVRNGADVLLKSLFVGFGGRTGLVIFGALLLGIGATLIWRDRRSGGALKPRWFLWMGVESLAYAWVFGFVAGSLTAVFLRAVPHLAVGQFQRLGLSTQLMVSLGAGIYEELLFRVLLVGGLAWLARSVLGWSPTVAGVLATIIGALVFSAFHYIGPFGDPLRLPSFVFRTIAGILFSGLYLLRGFGITAWTHALYDVMLAL